MGRYKFTNKAVEDLTKIWNYTVIEWSESQADPESGYRARFRIRHPRRRPHRGRWQDHQDHRLVF